MAKRHTIETFWSRIAKAGPTDCWEWQGGRNPKGYGYGRGKTRYLPRKGAE